MTHLGDAECTRVVLQVEALLEQLPCPVTGLDTVVITLLLTIQEIFACFED